MHTVEKISRWTLITQTEIHIGPMKSFVELMSLPVKNGGNSPQFGVRTSNFV